MKKKIKFEFVLSGVIIALVLCSMISVIFAITMTDMQENYDLSGQNIFSKYNHTASLVSDVEDIRNKTDIKQESGILDVIGGYFSSGYTAIKISLGSLDLFNDIMTDAADDVPAFAFFREYLMTILLIGIFIGVVITVLVKMRI